MDPTIRAGDADRDAVAARLRTAHAEGRLTVDELGERLDAALAARTIGDLEPLTKDLPPTGHGRVARTGDEASPDRPRHRGAPLGAAWGAWLTAVLVNVAIWLAVSLGSGDLVYFWPVWVAGPWGAVLLARTLSGRWHPR